MRHSHLLTVYKLGTIFSEGEALLLLLLGRRDLLVAPEKPHGEEQRVTTVLFRCCAKELGSYGLSKLSF